MDGRITKNVNINGYKKDKFGFLIDSNYCIYNNLIPNNISNSTDKSTNENYDYDEILLWSFPFKRNEIIQNKYKIISLLYKDKLSIILRVFNILNKKYYTMKIIYIINESMKSSYI